MKLIRLRMDTGKQQWIISYVLMWSARAAAFNSSHNRCQSHIVVGLEHIWGFLIPIKKSQMHVAFSKIWFHNLSLACHLQKRIVLGWVGWPHCGVDLRTGCGGCGSWTLLIQCSGSSEEGSLWEPSPFCILLCHRTSHNCAYWVYLTACRPWVVAYLLLPFSAPPSLIWRGLYAQL